MTLYALAASAVELIGKGQVLRPTPAEYPANALEQRAEGQIKVSIDRMPEGTIVCNVVSRSETSELNDASCPLVVPRLREMTWASGRSLTVKIGWRIPAPGVNLDYGGAVPFDPSLWVRAADIPVSSTMRRAGGRTSVSFAVGVDGTASDCRIEVSSGVPTLDQKFCRLIVDRAAFLPAISRSGELRETRGRTAVTWWTTAK